MEYWIKLKKIKNMEKTFLAETKTWWITNGEHPRAGVLEKGESLLSFGEILTFTNKFKWELAKKEFPGIKVVEVIGK
jgi:hypothetical protein